jgi:transcriptional regulator, XRE family
LLSYTAKKGDFCLHLIPVMLLYLKKGGEKMTTGELIKQRRIELGMTQEELASKMGFKTKASISRLESNDRKLPLSKLEKMAILLDIPPSRLMGWDDDGLEFGDKYNKNYYHQKFPEPIMVQGNLLEVLNILPTLTDKELELVSGMLALLLEEREHFHQ